jgi:CelD/BcsL family acetyltransferase involved in cellulose biosynthesis
MVKVVRLRSEQELDRLRGRWCWLEAQCGGTLFQGYELNRRAARWFGGRETPLVIVAESDAGMAILPAVRRAHEVGLIGETLFDYRDVLSAGDGAVLELAWQELAREGVPLEVTALRGEAARLRWRSMEPREFCNAPTTRASDVTAREFVAAHHKSAKASRRLARQGLRLVRRESGLRAVAEWVYRRKAEWSGGSQNLFRDRLRQDFMLELVCGGVLPCTIWSYEERSGEVAAALVTFRHGSTRHFYTIHHDARWASFSPGQGILFEVTRESLHEGLDVDFMTGEYAYKNRLATAMVPLYRVLAPAWQLSQWRSEEAGEVRPAA